MYQSQFASTFQPDTSSTTLAEIMAAFSYALDLTEGQPAGHSIRACWIAMQLAHAAGLPPADRRIIYYGTLLKDLGCSSNAARIAELYLTDDRTLKHDFKLLAPGTAAALQFVIGKTGKGHSFAARGRVILNIVRNGAAITHELIQTRCTRGADIARQLRFPEEVAGAISALDEHWDGGGKPLGLAGSAIPLPSQYALLAQIADVFQTAGGPDAARQEIAARAGSWFDPDLARLFLRVSASDAFWATLRDPLLEIRLRDLEPPEQRILVDEEYLDSIASAFGAVIDAKSPYTGGHSHRVGMFADALGRALGLDDARVRTLKRAAILHDVGKLAVSSCVLEKPGKLDDVEWEEMRSHAAQTTQILGRIGPLSRMAAIAGAHHERLDGRGYPLGLDQHQIVQEARIITVCDFYDALTADRPYRAAMPPEKALAIMGAEVGKAIDGDCFAALRATVMASQEGEWR